MRSIENNETEIIYEYDEKNYIASHKGWKIFRVYYKNEIDKKIMIVKNIDTAFVVFGLMQTGIDCETIEATLLILKLK